MLVSVHAPDGSLFRGVLRPMMRRLAGGAQKGDTGAQQAAPARNPNRFGANNEKR
jgi:hypothetical protein